MEVEEKDKGAEEVFEEIIAEKFPEMVKSSRIRFITHYKARQMQRKSQVDI